MQNPHTDPSGNTGAVDPQTSNDQDLHKGAVESPEGQGNPNGSGLDDQGWPNDEVAIAQDVLGANEDETQG